MERVDVDLMLEVSPNTNVISWSLKESVGSQNGVIICMFMEPTSDMMLCVLGY